MRRPAPAHLALLLPALLAAAPGPGRGAELELGYGRDRATGPGPDWQALSLGAAWTGEARARAEAGALRQERFGLADWDFRAAAATPLGGWTLGLEATGSATHRVVPVASAAVEVGRGLGGGLAASARGRWARYRPAGGQVDAGLGSLTLERYAGPWRAGATAYGAAVGGALGGSLRLFLDRSYLDRSRVGLSLAGGRELDVTEALEVRSLRTWTAAATGLHALDQAWALTWEVGLQWLPGLTTRLGARLGVRLHL